MLHTASWSTAIVVGLVTSSAIGQETARELAKRDAMIANLESALAKEKSDSADLKAIFAARSKQYREEIDEARAKLVELLEKTGDEREELEGLVDQVLTASKRLADRVEELERWQVDERLQSFDAKTGRGVVPLGSKHGVRRRLRFFVGRPTPAEPRVPIVEVVRVLGPESSEVRLLPTKAMTGVALEEHVGDDLHAPWWTAGETRTVAIVGRMETGSDYADRRQPSLHGFLKSQGAEIVLDVNEVTANVNGELSDDITLVVRGELEDDRGGNIERKRRYEEVCYGLLSEARRRGIPVVTEEQFLARTGGKPLPLTDEDIEAIQEERIRELRRKFEEMEKREAAGDE